MASTVGLWMVSASQIYQPKYIIPVPRRGLAASLGREAEERAFQ